jgi:hypothetical protein
MEWGRRRRNRREREGHTLTLILSHGRERRTHSKDLSSAPRRVPAILVAYGRVKAMVEESGREGGMLTERFPDIFITGSRLFWTAVDFTSKLTWRYKQVKLNA